MTVFDAPSANTVGIRLVHCSRALMIVSVAGVPAKPFGGRFEFESFELAATTVDEVVMEVDEFCLLDRALTDDEVAALAGRKEVWGK
jgi:hypothetical protein